MTLPEEIQPFDDEGIPNDSGLIRHISNDTNHVVYDDNRKCRRISSGAFSASSDDPYYGLSVDIGNSLERSGLPLDAMVPPGFGAVSLNVGAVRGLLLLVGADPIPKENRFGLTENMHHGQVWGVRTPKMRRRLHKLVQGWIVVLDDVELK